MPESGTENFKKDNLKNLTDDNMNQSQLLEYFDMFAANARAVLESKNKDYANADALSNFKLSAAVSGIAPEAGCLNQIAIKVSRAGVLINKGQAQNEPLTDTAMDMFNYAFLFAALLKDQYVHPEVSNG